MELYIKVLFRPGWSSRQTTRLGIEAREIILLYVTIRITCPCVLYPRTPHFYIVLLGFTGVYIFFLFLLKNIDCGYSLEPPR